MPSLLVVVFVVQLLIHLVNTLGAATINNILWNIYNRLPTPTSQAAAEQKKLKAQFLKIRTEMNGTSGQDEFAKWAKLRRQHDKLLEQLEKTKASVDSTKANFDRIVSGLRWLGTNGLRYFLQFWFQKQAMFYIPKGWVPYYGEWLLSFPRAPLGSISIQAWWLACAAIILLVSDAIVATFALITTARTSTANSKREPIKVPSEKESATMSSEGKKEL